MTKQELSIEQRLMHVRSIIDREEESFDNGEAINFDSLEGHVRDLCEAIAALPKEDGKCHVATLQSIMDQLGGLAAKITNQKDFLQTELTKLNRQKAAQTAYTKQQHHSNKITEE